MKQKNKQQNTGITLIALIITIIILLILAGISLNLLINKNDLIQKTGQVSEETLENYRKEAIELAVSEIYMLKEGVTKLEDIEENHQILENYLKDYEVGLSIENVNGKKMLVVELKKNGEEYWYSIDTNFDIKQYTEIQQVEYNAEYSDQIDENGRVEAFVTFKFKGGISRVQTPSGTDFINIKDNKTSLIAFDELFLNTDYTFIVETAEGEKKNIIVNLNYQYPNKAEISRNDTFSQDSSRINVSSYQNCKPYYAFDDNPNTWWRPGPEEAIHNSFLIYDAR